MHLEQLFRLSGEIVRSPSFPAEELERSRGLQLSDLANRASRPGFVASRNAANLLFGPEHPYGESLLGTPEGLGSIGLADLESWHRERARPGATTIVAVGDTTLGEIASLAERHFGDWPESIGPAREVPGKPPTAERRRIRIVDRPSAAQTELRVVRVGLSRSSPDYLAARLVSLILGGKFTSRLNLSLREERGITYGVHSRLSGRRGAGPFTVACAVDTEATGVAVGEVIAEFDRLAADPVPETELEDAKNYLLGTFPYRIQTLEGQADHLAEIALHELALDSLETLPEEVRSASAELVGRCARDLLRSDDLAIVAVGPAGLLRPQLEPFGEVELTAENDSSEAS
jgi:zinc protease